MTGWDTPPLDEEVMREMIREKDLPESLLPGKGEL
jgi:hypothetical protein